MRQPTGDPRELMSQLESEGRKILMTQLKSSQAGEILSSLGACVCAESFQLHPTLCDSMDYSQPGSSLHGDSSGKWVAMPSSSGSSYSGIECASLRSSLLADGFFTTSPTCDPIQFFSGLHLIRESSLLN